MSDWKETTLEKEIDLLTGYSFKSNQYTENEEDILLLRGDNIAQGYLRWDNAKKWSIEKTIGIEAYFLKEADIVLAMDRPWIEAGLKFAYLSKKDLPCLLVQRVSCLRAKKSLNQAFLRYIIQSYEFTQFVIKIQTGTAVPHISGNQVKSFNFLLPQLAEQKQIADVLSCLDAKIENLRRQNETLEAIAQTLFKHWFIDFEFPDADGKPYKSSGGEMVDSAIGDIPEGWKLGNLGSVVEVFMGYPFKSEFYTFNSGVRVVRGENVSLGFLRWDTEKRWEQNLDLYGDYFLTANDYVIGMDGSRVGRNRAIILESDLPLIVAQRVARLRAKDSQTQGYINILLMNNRFEKYVDFIKTGTSIPHISGQQIKDFECIIPSKQQLKEFSSFYDTWAKKTSIIRQQIETLTKTRDALLPKLMSGQLRIEE